MEPELWNQISDLVTGLQEHFPATVFASVEWDSYRIEEPDSQGAWYMSAGVDDPRNSGGIIGGYVVITDALLARLKQCSGTLMEVVGRQFGIAARRVVIGVEEDYYINHMLSIHQLPDPNWGTRRLQEVLDGSSG